MRGAVGGPRRIALGGAGLLAAAMAASGLLAYVFQIVAARTLDQSDYGSIGVLWGGLFVLVVLLFRPLEQTTSRAVAHRRARGQEAATVLRSVAIVFGGCIVALAIAAILGWSTVREHFFAGSNFLTAMLFLGTAGYGVQYVTRGILGGLGWFRGLTGVHLGDGSIRVLVALPLLAGFSKNVAAAALAAAGLGAAIVPLWRARGRIAELRRGTDEEHFHLRATLGFAAPASVIAGSDQLLVNGAPLLVIAAGAGTASSTSKAAAVVFAATMLVRVPVFLFSGVAGSILPNLTRLNAAEDHGLFAKTVKRVCLLFAAATVVIVLVAAVLGPTAMTVLYGPAYTASAGDLALLGFAAGCYLASATVSQALLALARTGTAAVVWASSAALFIGVYVLSGGSELHRIALATALATLLNALLLAVIFARRARRG